ncbi:MurR/RpiR family transcriptional regulator [Microlunatus antarcticus]|uniref:MurR/RpiR family transcriptional regulator n=1 Tax=Microlunatus antarcticus TaxID=53388 RepID=UPI0038CC1C7B
MGHIPRTDGSKPSRPATASSPNTPASGQSRSSLSVLIRVRGALPSLRPAEQRVAEAVLADPAGVSERSITSLARLCRTSETTVLRFCRALGLAGYPELRIALARAAQGEEDDRASGTASDGVIVQTDSMAEMVAKITYADQRSIADTGAAVDVVALQAAVDALAKARRVDVYGVGASALVAQELHGRLHRLGLASGVWADPHAALSSAAGLVSGDVAVGISHTGTTIDVIDALRVARTRGATTIAITNFDRAPIVGQSDIVLTTAARETTFRTGSMSSRVSQLVLVDCLFTGVAMRSYDRSVSALDAARSVLRARHTERHERQTGVGRPGLVPTGGLTVQA